VRKPFQENFFGCKSNIDCRFAEGDTTAICGKVLMFFYFFTFFSKKRGRCRITANNRGVLYPHVCQAQAQHDEAGLI
jgi:hypothetical protein